MKQFFIKIWVALVAAFNGMSGVPYVAPNQPMQGMAKVKFSALISDMRNKLNGSVFAKNRSGAYLRTKVTPSNPQSIAQQAARNLLTTYSQGWKALTEVERTAWNGAVGSWASTDVFGDIKNPTGLQLYIRLNVNISLASGVALVLPPLSVGVDPVLTLSFIADDSANTIVLTGTPTPVPADHAMYIEATAPMSAGISNANSKFRHVQTIAPAGAVGDISAAYIAKFGAFVTGQKIFVRAKMIRLSTGEVSQPLVAFAIVVP